MTSSPWRASGPNLFGWSHELAQDLESLLAINLLVKSLGTYSSERLKKENKRKKIQ